MIEEIMKTETNVETTKEMKPKMIISSNWYGHPADIPMRLVVVEHTKFNNNQLYALNWYSKYAGKFWGTYDISLESLAEVICRKISLQDSNFSCFNKIFINDGEIFEKLKSKFDKEIKVYLAIF